MFMPCAKPICQAGVTDPSPILLLQPFSNAATWADWKLKEVKNGRLAMMALLGFASQYAATGKGPVGE